MENPHHSSPESCRFFSQFEKEGYYNTDAVYLNAGGPGTEILRMLPPLIEAATSHRMQRELEGDAQLFQYGVEEGHWQFRSFLATFLTEQYGEHVDSDQLFLTGGASSGLWLILSKLFGPGTPVFVEDPTYYLALRMFQDLKMTIVPVKTDDDGILLDDLEEKLQQHVVDKPSGHGFPLSAMVYLIPTFHNPTGRLLPEGRCRQIITLAREYGVTVVCDDVYNLLHYGESPVAPRRLFSYDIQSHSEYRGNVISNGSFSKILSPGLRIGWLEAPTWAIEKLKTFAVLQSGGGLSTFTSGIITSMLALDKMNTHLHKVRNIYRTQMEAVAELLKEELPEGCSLKSPARGGYFLWVELPESINASHLLLFSKKEFQVSFSPGQKSSPTGAYTNYFRLSISFYPLDVLLAAVRRLCQAIAAFQVRASEEPKFWRAYE